MACANKNEPNTNNSQFFITLCQCEDLNSRYTIFGKVTGDTVFNVIRISEIPIDKNNRPIEPIKIKDVEVLWNPFEDKNLDIYEVPLNEKKGNENEENLIPKIKNKSLLSFDDGEEGEIEELSHIKLNKRIKSVHDVVKNDKIIAGNSILDKICVILYD